MAGTLHQGILALFREDPWLAFDMLGIARPVQGTPIDRRGEIERDGKAAFTIRQGYPDLVLVHRHPAKKRRGVVITVEAQTAFDQDKRWSIPVYQSHLADEHRCRAGRSWSRSTRGCHERFEPGAMGTHRS